MSHLKLTRESWSSQSIFILAAIGAAVGLGNLWKFPYIAGENGGGAFVLVYLGCILLIGLPILMAELALGRAGQANPVQSMASLARENNASRFWWLLGLNGIIAGALILSFYSVIAGWAVSYFTSSAMGEFVAMSSEEAEVFFSGLLASPETLLLWHTVVMVVTLWIVSRGVKKGLERAITFMMPGLLVILLVLLGYALSTGYLGASFEFLFAPDFSKLTWDSVLVAMGHAFFTLSIGMGAIMVYGSYLGREHSIVKASLWVVFADTAVALLAGLVIFAIVFANSMAPSAGPGLLFQTLPVAFGQMWGGWFFGTLFFALVVMAALSSAISLIEPAISWLEQNWGYSRVKATWGLGALIWLVGVGTILSFTHWSEVHFIGERTFFDSLDFLTSNIMLPLGGMMMAVFSAWVLSEQTRREELPLSTAWERVMLFDLKWIAPIAVLVVFANSLSMADSVSLILTLSLALYLLYVFNNQRCRQS